MIFFKRDEQTGVLWPLKSSLPLERLESDHPGKVYHSGFPAMPAVWYPNYYRSINPMLDRKDSRLRVLSWKG